MTSRPTLHEIFCKRCNSGSPNKLWNFLSALLELKASIDIFKGVVVA